ncbi:ankyrin repeat-containing protein [Rhypophila decipiens]
MPQEALPNANPFILAADDPNALLALLNDNPSLATDQDSHGYSLVHAAASYNHLDLLRQLIREFSVPVDLRDEDGETALFVVETLDAAKVLVQELALDPKITNDEGQTAREKIESEGEFPDVVRYLASLETTRTIENGNGQHMNEAAAVTGTTTDLPGGIQIRMGTMEEAEAEGLEPDPEFRRRIEELAARDDFQTPEGQAELRRLVEEAVLGQGGVVGEERNVRPRQE